MVDGGWWFQVPRETKIIKKIAVADFTDTSNIYHFGKRVYNPFQVRSLKTKCD
jgi:hypothetical protein